ncbi:autotransporter outer membrane beta-barrel domain-containing protein [Microbulbifer thermotolerans]|uniref:autotransporter domain-containing protein n=1 Tax=Microbulbifer thermotolerans TaxID=252514 RepID=UPI00224A5C43|nr:autotransporter outer membrane beta-barrel domain-containing protein [Microbulbifer thermotolerans]MCX2834083.1 autotransporter outer membrane beta-barrel domain-containing protein [Microbulbifer thermotolerans]MCX2842723.1 autotransporter outer membrane beta-barrel domain-containing protein [Microbulbifer thermotolerans]
MQLKPLSPASLAAILCITLPAEGLSQGTPATSELVVHTQIKKLALLVSLDQLDGFQQRRQEWRSDPAGYNNIRLQLHHGDLKLDWQGDTPSRIDGTLSSLKISRDLYSGPSCRGSQQGGISAGSSFVNGDSSALLSERGANLPVGQNQLQSHFIGAYFSDYRNTGHYFDLQAKLAYLRTDSRAHSGRSATRHGVQIALSAESGLDIALGEHYNLEPQAQLLANYTSLNAFSANGYRMDTGVTPELNLRLGLRAYATGKPHFAFANFWYTLDGDDELYGSGQLELKSPRGARWLELGLGTRLLQLPFADLSLDIRYRSAADDYDWSDISANLGLSWAW